jgi:hypothetical protein
MSRRLVEIAHDDRNPDGLPARSRSGGYVVRLALTPVNCT